MTSRTPTLLLIDDFLPDLELYRRYLLADSKHAYHLLEASTASAGLELCRTQIVDAILLDYSLPDFDGLSFLEALHSQSNGNSPPVVMITGQGDEVIAARAINLGAEDYLVKQHLTPELLQVTMHSDGFVVSWRNVTARKQAELERQQLERERIVNQITQQIHQSLDVERVLGTAVNEVRRFLSGDLAFIYRFNPDFSGVIVVESVSEGWRTALNAQGENLWVLLVLNQCARPRCWHPSEIDLLQQLAAQIGIAIQQAELHQQVQAELTGYD